MILWQDVSRSERMGPPPCLLDADGRHAPDLQGREEATGRLWAVGDPRLLGPHADGWVDLADGWRARVLPGFDPVMLSRRVPWCPSIALVPDAQGRMWPVAAPLTRAGEPRIIGTFDESWRRILTDEQAALERLALAARQGWLASSPDDDTPPIDPRVADVCAWAVGAICAATHISPQALSRLGLLDETLAKGAALAVAGAAKVDA